MQCGEGSYSVSGSRNEYSSTCVHQRLKLGVQIISKTFPEVLDCEFSIRREAHENELVYLADRSYLG
jgi:hypothetical protein